MARLDALRPPARPPHLLSRDSEGLTAAGRLRVVQAGPGYGKTFLLHQWVEGHEGSTLWFAVPDVGYGVAAFFQALIRGFKRLIPGFQVELPESLTDAVGDARLAWEACFAAWYAYGDVPVTLVLDDAHHLCEGESPILRGIVPLLTRLPVGMRLFVASQRRVPWPLMRLCAAGQCQLVNQDQLAFSLDEAKAFFLGRDGSVPEHLAEKLARVEGWPLGLSVGVDTGLGGGHRRWQEALLEVVEELLVRQSPQQQVGLIKLALLQRFDELTLEELPLDANAGPWFETLLDGHLVVSVSEGFKVVGHLAQGLREWARRHWSARHCADWHGLACTHFRDRGWLDEALFHALQAGQIAGAVTLACEVFPRWRFDQAQGAIRRAIALVPQAERVATPFWMLWAGHLASWEGQHTEARLAYAEAARLYAATGEATAEFQARYRCLVVALLQQDESAVAALRDRLGALLEAALPEDRADWSLAEAYCAEQTGELAQMRTHNEAVLAIPIAGSREVAASHVIAWLNLYTHGLHTGDVLGARRAVQQAEAIARDWKLSSYATYAAVLCAHLALETNQLEEAGQLFRALGDDWHRCLDWRDRACGYVMWAGWAQVQGAWADAENALELARKLFEGADYPQGRTLVQERAAWLAIRRKQPDRAMRLTDAIDVEQASNLYEQALALPRARALLMLNRPDDALTLLQRAIQMFQQVGATLHWRRAALYATAARMAMGQRETARQELGNWRVEVLAAGQGFLLESDDALWAELRPLLQAQEPSRALRIRLLGTLEVMRDGVRLDDWTRRRTQVLLAALVLYPRGLTPAELEDLLGNEGGGGKWRVTASYLRQVLEPGLKSGRTSHFVHMDAERYCLNPEAVEWVDVRVFELECQAALRCRREDPTRAAAHYATALGHFHGDLLADAFFARYFENEREALRAQAVEALLWLMDWDYDRGDRKSATQHLTRVLQIAPADEDVALKAIAYFNQCGEHQRANLVYWDHRKARQLRFGLPPAEAVEAAHSASTSKTAGVRRP